MQEKNPQLAGGHHVRGQALHAMDRLRDHIERIDEGKYYAVDDLSVVLRLLVHPGRGNDLLRRLSQSSTARIAVLASRPPEVEGALFSVGLLPARAGTESLGATSMLLEEWITSPFLSVVVDDLRKTWTWAEFINAYANKWGGAHLDDEIPLNLSVVDQFAFGGLSLSGYLLRTAGVMVWKAAQTAWADAMFRRSGEPLSSEELSMLRVTSVGTADDPSDRLRFGELQFLAYRGDSAELVLLMSRTAQCQARLAFGGKLHYEITIAPENATALSAPISEPRMPNPPGLTQGDFSEGRTSKVKIHAFIAD